MAGSSSLDATPTFALSIVPFGEGFFDEEFEGADSYGLPTIPPAPAPPLPERLRIVKEFLPMLLIPDESSLVRVRVDTQKATRAALALEGKSLYNLVLSLYANPACAPSPKSFWDDGVWKVLSPDVHKVSPQNQPHLQKISFASNKLVLAQKLLQASAPLREAVGVANAASAGERALAIVSNLDILKPLLTPPPKTKKSKHASAAGGVRVVPASSPAPAVQRGSAAERGSAADTPPSQHNSAASTPPTALATLLPTTQLRPGSVDPAVSQASFSRSLRMLDANASPLAIAAGQENGDALRAVLDVAKVLFPSHLPQEVELPNGEALSEGGAALFSYMNGLKPGMLASSLKQMEKHATARAVARRQLANPAGGSDDEAMDVERSDFNNLFASLPE